MRLINEAPFNDDYVVATNTVHSIRDLVTIASRNFGFDVQFEGSGLDEIGIDRKSGKKIVCVDKNYFRPSDVSIRQGDYSKIKKSLGWSPTTSFEDMIDRMCEVDIVRAKAEHFIF